jgi:preprotein translocase subunit SecG
MEIFLKFLHIAVCLFLIIVVLLQAGKGGGVGIAFGGGGGSQTVFGSSGAGNFLTKLTSVTAFIFLVTSLGLSHYSSQQDSKRLQHLADRKADEKKQEDVRSEKLKAELDKAREAAKKMGAVAPATPVTETPGAAAPLKLEAPKAFDTKADKATDLPAAQADKKVDTKVDTKVDKKKAKLKAPAEGDKAVAVPATGADGEPVKPKRKRHVAPVEGAEAVPAAPAEAPAAPAAPAQ